MEDTQVLDHLSSDHSSDGDGPCSSFENDRDNLAYGELLNILDTEELTKLRKCFIEKKVDKTVKEPKGSVPPRFRGSKLTRDEFITSIANIIGSPNYEHAANKLFDHIVERNAEEHKAFVWWEQILDAMIEWMVSQTHVRPPNIVKESFCQLYSLPHCKQETIIRVVPVETKTTFCYVLVSKYGRVGIYDWNMGLLEQYEMRLGTQIVNQVIEVRRTTWVVDAIYLKDASMLLIAASDRSLHVYSASGLVHVPTYHISGLPNTPTCLHYTIGATTEDPSRLLFGDDHGSITTMFFHQPQYSLFKRTSTDRMDTYYWKELKNQGDWVTISTEYSVHKDEVIKVEYFSDNNTVVSCSSDPNTTLVINYIGGVLTSYVFQISRGVRCFHLDLSLKLLVTGSKDTIIRIWNPVVTKKPIASLFGHKTCIIDVRILKHLSVILSMSNDAVLKVWDIAGQCCIQTLPMVFPVYGAMSRTPEFGVQTFYPGPVSCDPPTTSLQGKCQPRATLQQTHPASLLSTTSTTKQDRASAYKNVTTSFSISWSSNTDDNNDNMMSEIKSEIDHALSDKSTHSSNVEEEWNRMELLVVCCNYVVILQLSGRDLGEGDATRVGEALPAPHHELDPAVPSPWLTADSAQVSMLNVDYPSQLSSNSGATSPIPPTVLETIQKSLGEEVTYHFKALTSSCHNLNAAKARQYIDQTQVRSLVEQCAPHLALNLSPLEEIKFSQPLPTTARMRNFDLSNPDKLLKAKLKRDSTSTVGSKTSNTSTSSTTRSGRNK